MKNLLKNSALITVVVFVAACTGDDGDDGGTRDGGPADVGRDGGAAPDRDRDTIPDDVDNCPDVENATQLDLDEDGLGNACDSCLAYPNNGTEAPHRQQDCVLIQEVEDNDTTPQAIMLPEGMVVEIAGVVESSSEGVVDRFGFETTADLTFYRLHVSPGEESPLEPVVVVDSEHYTQTREADGAGALVREVACNQPGDYTIAVGDRRAYYDGEARGGEDVAYRLVVEPYAPEPAIIEMQGRQSKTVEIDLEEPGRIYYAVLPFEPRDIRLLAAFETSTALGRGESSSGLDTIIAIKAFENDNRATGTTDSALGVNAGGPQTGPLIIDHHRAYGVGDYRFTLIVRPNDPLEQEPNDSFEDAIVLEPLAMSVRANIGEPISAMNGPPDEDWYAVDVLEAGKIVQVGINGSGLTEAVATAFVDDGGMPRPSFQSRPPMFQSFLGLNIVAFREGRYWIRVRDVANESPPYVGGNGTMGQPDYRYILGAGEAIVGGGSVPIQEPVVEADAELSARLVETGMLRRHPILVTSRTRLVVSTTTTAPDIEPHLSLYGPGQVGLFAEGSGSIDVEVDPATEPYVLGVRNGNGGLPHFPIEPAYTLQLRYLPPN